MSPPIWRRRFARVLSGFALVCGAVPALRAEPPRLPQKTQQAVNRAIDGGVKFLYATQGPLGSWSANKHIVGYTALPGLTLLECGESPDQPALLKAAILVRRASATLDTTYEISLSILFLDRMGEESDKPIIEMLAARLIAGQTTTGGWSYRCPILSRRNQRDLLTVLRKLDDRPHFDQALLFPGDRPAQGGLLPPPSSSASASDLRPGSGEIPKRPGFPRADTDKKDKPAEAGSSGALSATQRPGESPVGGTEWTERRRVLRLPRKGWCIKRGEDVPDDRSKTKPPERVIIPPIFRRLPVLMDPARLVLRDPPGRDRQARAGTTDNSNTQFATLALWAARRHGVPMKRSLNLLVYRFRTSQNPNGSWGYRYRKGGWVRESAPMTCVGLLGLAVGHGIARDKDKLDAKAAARRARDPQLIGGLVALSRHVGWPTGRLGNLRQPNLYFLWSVERVGVLFNLPTIGGKDWYRWAAESLVANQQRLGNWTGGGYPGASAVSDTCLALLVLKKTNLANDLTSQLRLNPGDLAGAVEKKLGPGLPATDEASKAKSPGGSKAKGTKKDEYGSGKPNASGGTTGQPGNAPTRVQPVMAPAGATTAPPSSGPAPASTTSSDASRSEKGGGKKLWMIFLCVAGVLLLGTSIFLLVNRSRQEAPVLAGKKKKPAGGASRSR